MQPEDSSLVRRSPLSIYDLEPTLTFLILGRERIGVMERTSAPLLGRLGYAVDGAWEENLALGSLLQAVGQQ
jgi:hypothetical protein